MNVTENWTGTRSPRGVIRELGMEAKAASPKPSEEGTSEITVHWPICPVVSPQQDKVTTPDLPAAREGCRGNGSTIQAGAAPEFEADRTAVNVLIENSATRSLASAARLTSRSCWAAVRAAPSVARSTAWRVRRESSAILVEDVADFSADTAALSCAAAACAL